MTYTALGVAMVYWNLPRNRLRKDLLGLKPRSKTNSFFTDTRGRPLTTLYAYSPLVAPRPRDWPRVAQLTGYWTLEDNTGWEPSPEFRAWLAAGPPPVYFGFGSMPFGAKRNTELLREGVMRWGGRAVVARGWGGIAPEALPETIFAIDRRHTKSCSSTCRAWCITAAPAPRPRACAPASRRSPSRRGSTSRSGAVAYTISAAALPPSASRN